MKKGFVDWLIKESPDVICIQETKANKDQVEFDLIEKLKEIPGVEVGYPKGAFYCIVQLPLKNSDAFAQWLLEEFDVDGETIMVAPAAGFYSSPGVGQNQIRIAYVLNKESLIKAVHILKQALVVYKE